MATMIVVTNVLGVIFLAGCVYGYVKTKDDIVKTALLAFGVIATSALVVMNVL